MEDKYFNLKIISNKLSKIINLLQNKKPNNESYIIRLEKTLKGNSKSFKVDTNMTFDPKGKTFDFRDSLNELDKEIKDYLDGWGVFVFATKSLKMMIQITNGMGSDVTTSIKNGNLIWIVNSNAWNDTNTITDLSIISGLVKSFCDKLGISFDLEIRDTKC